MSVLPLHEQHEFLADWHLPNEPRTISGKLHYSTDRAELQLIDGFTRVEGDMFRALGEANYPAIHGVSAKGEAITMLNAKTFGMGFNLSGGGLRQPERMLSSLIVVGDHVTPDTVYAKARWYVPGIEVWLGRRAISVSIQAAPTETSLQSKTVVVQAPAVEEMVVPTISATVAWGVHVTQNTNSLKALEVLVNGYVELATEAPKPLTWFLAQWQKLYAMLTLAVGVPVPANALQMLTQQGAQVLDVLVCMESTARCAIEHVWQCWMPRSALGTNFPEFVQRWFESIDTVMEPCQLAVAVMSSKNTWLQIEFLSLLQAIEGFHRGRHENSRGWKLPARLQELHLDVGQDIAKLIFGGNGHVPRSWLDTRNFLTHWEPKLRDKALRGHDMLEATVRMQHFIRALCLLMAGVSKDVLLQSFQGHSDAAQHLRQLNSQRSVDAPTTSHPHS